MHPVECPLLDPRSPLGLPPRPLHPPKIGEAPSPGGQGPVLGRRFPDQRAERADRCNGQTQDKCASTVDFVPVSFSPPTTTTGGLTFGVPLARSADVSSCCCVYPPLCSLLSESPYSAALYCRIFQGPACEIRRLLCVLDWRPTFSSSQLPSSNARSVISAKLARRGHPPLLPCPAPSVPLQPSSSPPSNARPRAPKPVSNRPLSRRASASPTRLSVAGSQQPSAEPDLLPPPNSVTRSRGSP